MVNSYIESYNFLLVFANDWVPPVLLRSQSNGSANLGVFWMSCVAWLLKSLEANRLPVADGFSNDLLVVYEWFLNVFEFWMVFGVFFELQNWLLSKSGCLLGAWSEVDAVDSVDSWYVFAGSPSRTPTVVFLILSCPLLNWCILWHVFYLAEDSFMFFSHTDLYFKNIWIVFR